ncbi:MAG: SPFH domain-containing protein [Candidatus Izimaplasma sp.]|nr:SPFH domain-containing protein [Candidatus Izimaplasma bacterium]
MAKQTEVIFKGHPEAVIWKSDVTTLTKKSKIYSRKDCDIIFLRKGAYLGAFDDREEFYIVNTKGSGFLTSLLKKEKTITDCDIYYINRVAQLENKWGTPNKIDVYDRGYDMHTDVGANGSYKFSIKNSMKLFSKVQGSNEALSQEMVRDFFRSELNVEIRNAIAKVFLKNKYGLDDIQVITTKEKEIAKDLKEILTPVFEEYGVQLDKFFIERFYYDEDFIEKVKSVKKESIINKMQFDDNKNLRKGVRKEIKKDSKVPNQGPITDKVFCTNCGHPNSKEANFCSKCGSAL